MLDRIAKKARVATDRLRVGLELLNLVGEENVPTLPPCTRKNRCGSHVCMHCDNRMREKFMLESYRREIYRERWTVTEVIPEAWNCRPHSIKEMNQSASILLSELQKRWELKTPRRKGERFLAVGSIIVLATFSSDAELETQIGLVFASTGLSIESVEATIDRIFPEQFEPLISVVFNTELTDKEEVVSNLSNVLGPPFGHQLEYRGHSTAMQSVALAEAATRFGDGELSDRIVLRGFELVDGHVVLAPVMVAGI